MDEGLAGLITYTWPLTPVRWSLSFHSEFWSPNVRYWHKADIPTVVLNYPLSGGKADMPITLRNAGHGHFLIDLDRSIRLPGGRLRVHIFEPLGAAGPVARLTQLFELLVRHA